MEQTTAILIALKWPVLTPNFLFTSFKGWPLFTCKTRSVYEKKCLACELSIDTNGFPRNIEVKFDP